MNVDPILEKSNKTNLILFFGLLAGQVVFLAGVIYTVKNNKITNQELEVPYLFILPLITLLAIFMAPFLFKQLLKKALEEKKLDDILAKYRSALLIRMALFEGANLFSTCIYLITGNTLAFVISASLLAFFILHRPSLERMKEDLKL